MKLHVNKAAFQDSGTLWWDVIMFTTGKWDSSTGALMLMLCNGNISSMYRCTSYANIILSSPAMFPGVFLSPRRTTLYEWALFKEKQVHVTCISVDVWHTSASLHGHHLRFLPLALCGYTRLEPMWEKCGFAKPRHPHGLFTATNCEPTWSCLVSIQLHCIWIWACCYFYRQSNHQ